MHLEQVFAVPKESHADKISGRFEGGCLSLFMPKKEVTDKEVSAELQQVPQRAVSSEEPRSEEPMQKEKQVAGDKKEEAPTQKAQPISSARKEEEPMPKEKAKDREETRAAAPDEKVSAEPEEVPRRAVSFEKPRSEPIQKEKPVAGDKKEEAPMQKDQPTSSARTEEEPIQKEKAKGGEEIRAAAPVYEEKPLTDEKKEEHLIQDEPIRKKKPMSSTVSDDRFEKYKKKGLAWKETIEEEVGQWLDYESIDRLLEKISNNKKIIAVAVAAFSVGFYVSRKLRSSGR